MSEHGSRQRPTGLLAAGAVACATCCAPLLSGVAATLVTGGLAAGVLVAGVAGAVTVAVAIAGTWWWRRARRRRIAEAVVAPVALAPTQNQPAGRTLLG